ncbi:serine/threonine-protein phosphatase 4 regulatory subunit 2-A [Brachyhypopomus gauderio]|uniref:serine/threonine-protein phosphatase 4 regulatory subunit 2-A n=1 Tax=Brachyhypopomus gauderio TaxID=698409 RepID=UPI0040439193
MEVDTLLGAFGDFEKKGKKETCPILDQLLCHIAKTGETMIQWSQFKSYFLFKLEKVMDDFKASSPEQRGPANPNVEYIPFEEMKERILKIVDGYSGIPFTIQRLCELLTEPKRNYSGTEKFLRGVEKNVMVVSCVYPSSEKNGSSCMNRMNGVMFPGSASAFSDRNVNGPGTPRPVNRPKHPLSYSVATNGLPDSTENKEQALELTERTVGDPVPSEPESLSRVPVKSKHREEEEEEVAGQEEEDTTRREAKRLRFDRDEEEREEEEEDTEDGNKTPPCAPPPESSTDTPPPPDDPEPKEARDVCVDEQEPSSTQPDPADDEGDKSGTEGSPGPTQSQDSESDPTEQHGREAEEEPPAEMQEAEEKLDPVSSSSSSSNGEEPAPASPSSTTEPPAESSSSAENNSDSPETADTMEQE